MSADAEARDGQRNWPSFTTMIVIGVLLGLVWGLFLGEYGAWVKWIGDAYVGLLQMTVLPYVALSLMCNVGRLSMKQGGRLASVAFAVLVLLWLIGLITLVVMRFSFPTWEAGSFFTTSLVSEPEPMNWLELFIPSNPFWSLTYNLVPAVVLFSLGLGVALIPVANKESLLDRLDILIEGLGRLNKLVVRLSPLGMFAIVGHTAGTLSPDQFSLLQGYIVVYAVASLLLSLWILPALIAACTPFSHRDVLISCRDVLLTAFIIGNTFVVLPMIIDAVKQLMAKKRLSRSDTLHAPEYTVQLAYPFPDVGRIVGLVFIPFAAWFYGSAVDLAMVPQLMATGFVGCFAKPVVTIPLLLDLAEIPADIFNLFLSVGVIAGRFGDLMKSMHLFAFSILTACYLTGAFRFSIGRLLTRGLTTVAVLVFSVMMIRSYLYYSFQDDYRKANLVVARPLLGLPSDYTVLDRSEPNPDPLQEGEDRMDRILRRGLVRIGVDTGQLPFCYYNQDGKLVGFDIDMAHQLARDVGVGIEFVPISADICTLLRADHFDLAMSGLEGTIRRATELPAMESYMEVTRAFVVPDYLRQECQTVKRMARFTSEETVRVAYVAGSLQSEILTTDTVLGTGYAVMKAGGVVDNVELVELKSEKEFFESDPPVADVLATNAEGGSAWTLKYPGYTVVKPRGWEAKSPLYYFVADQSQFREFVNSWLKLKRRNGTIQQLYDYWILGHDREAVKPRWCMMRDVLHWVD